MDLTASFYLLTLAGAAVILAVLAAYGWIHRETPAAPYFVWGVAANCAWAVMNLAGLLSQTPAAISFWHKVGYVAVANVPLAWFAFTLAYTSRDQWLTSRNMLILAVVPVMTVILVWTNDWHYWFWQSHDLVWRDGLWVDDVVFGPAGWLSIRYTQALMLLSIALIGVTMFRSNHLYRQQAVWVLAGFLAPLAANAIFVSGLGPKQDLTTASFALSGLLITIGVFRTRLLALAPIARDKVVEGLADAILVLDWRNRIVDLNPTAQRLLGFTAAQALGRPASECFQAWPALAQSYQALPTLKQDLVFGQGPESTAYELRDLPLTDRRGHAAGRLLVLHDVTAHKDAELRIQQLNAELEQRVQDRTRELEGTVHQLRQEGAERQHAETALRESEARYRTLVEISPDAIVLSDLSGQILMANAQTAALFGIPASVELRGLNALDYVAPQDRQRARENLLSRIHAPRSAPVEYTLWRHDQTEISGELNTSVFTDAAGQPRGYISIMRNITERRQAEALRRRRQITLELLNHAGRAFSSSLDLDQVLTTVLEEVRRNLDSIACSIWLTDPATGDAVCRQAAGPQNELVRGWRVPQGQGIVGWVIAHGEGVNLTDAQVDMRHYTGVDEKTQIPLRSMLAVPLLGRRATLGVIEVGNMQVGHYKEEDLTFLELLARTAVSAIENAALYQQAQHEIAQRTRAEETLSSANQRLQLLSRQLVEVQEAERRRLALELHDELGQMLNSIKLSLDLVPSAAAEDAPEPLQRARRLISQLIQQVRQLALDLRPAMLDDLGLVPALKSLFRRQTGQTGIQVQFENGVPDSRRFHPSIETAAYRIIQEAVTNATRHAKVRLVHVVLQADDGVLNLTVKDHGAGFDPSALSDQPASTGLAGMRERARLLGGDLEIESAPGLGTCLRVRLPVN